MTNLAAAGCGAISTLTTATSLLRHRRRGRGAPSCGRRQLQTPALLGYKGLVGQMFGDGLEQTRDVLAGHRRCLHKQQPLTFSKSLRSLEGYLPLIHHVRLVGSDSYDDVGVRASRHHLLHPSLRSLERHLVGLVIDHDGGRGPPIVHGRQAAEPLLAGGVPDVKLDLSAAALNCLGAEGATDGRLDALRKLVLQEALEDAGLANGCVTKEDDLEAFFRRRHRNSCGSGRRRGRRRAARRAGICSYLRWTPSHWNAAAAATRHGVQHERAEGRK
mmetsp:Transcript_71325/g.204651  ORF Transcript_71325/g.204651 Transcript_71325/m.204651 type:complete len:274 (+) Transcript_71325:128-949(+)